MTRRVRCFCVCVFSPVFPVIELSALCQAVLTLILHVAVAHYSIPQQRPQACIASRLAEASCRHAAPAQVARKCLTSPSSAGPCLSAVFCLSFVSARHLFVFVRHRNRRRSRVGRERESTLLIFETTLRSLIGDFTPRETG